MSTTGLELSPQSANVSALASAFNDADLHEDEEMQIWAIKDIEDGEVEHDNDGNMITILRMVATTSAGMAVLGAPMRSAVTVTNTT